MILGWFAVNNRFAGRRDRVRVLKANGQSVHVRLFGRVQPASGVEVEFQGFFVRRTEEHGRAVPENAIMRQCEFAALLVIHGDHFVRCAREDTLFDDASTGKQAVLCGHFHRALAYVHPSLPGANESFETLKFVSVLFGLGRFVRSEVRVPERVVIAGVGRRALHRLA